MAETIQTLDNSTSICDLLPVEVLEIIVQGVTTVRDKLNLRQVNRIFRDVTESILQKASTLSFWTPYLISDFKDVVPHPGNQFTTVVQIEKFLSTMKNHPGNPFPTCHVAFALNSMEDCHEHAPAEFYSKSIPKLLSTFGNHITSITYFGGLSEKHDMREVCRIIFEYVPNLKRLRLLISEMQNDNCTAIEEPVFTQLPLKYFFCLSILGCEDVSLADAIMYAYGNQITSFECDGGLIDRSTYFNEESKPFPRLTELKVEGVNDIIISKLAVCSQQMQWRLKWLSLVMKFDLPTKLSSLLQLINGVSFTLEVLCVHLHSKDIEYETYDRSCTEFPVLKKLVIDKCIFLNPELSHLLERFTDLEHLEILNYSFQNPTFDLNLCSPKLCIAKLQKNEWKRFPALKTISVFQKHNSDQLVQKLFRPKMGQSNTRLQCNLS